MWNIQKNCSVGIVGSYGMDRIMVPRPQIAQRIQRWTSSHLDPLQHNVLLIVQSSPTHSIRDRTSLLYRVGLQIPIQALL